MTERRRTTVGVVAGMAAALALTTTWQGTQAAFSGRTTNEGNTFAAGTVRLSDDDAGTAMFEVPTMAPGDSGGECIVVGYDGSLDSAVRLHAQTAITDGGTDGADLGGQLTFVIEYDDRPGTTSGAASCADFVPQGQVYDDSLAALAGSTDYASGVELYWDAQPGERRVFRVTYRLDDAAPDTVQGDAATVAFTWEAQNR